MSVTDYFCSTCGKRKFADWRALRQHARDAHGQVIVPALVSDPRESIHDPEKRSDLRKLADELEPAEKIALLDSMDDDLPDGAYFAMAEELGIETEDFLE